jgi:adenosylcobinamide-phosphate synthase
MVAIPLGALLCGRRWVRSFIVALRDWRKHDSPNAAIPEAAFAGALGVWLGGPSTYGGTLVDRPRLGDPLREVRVEDISAACTLSLVTAFTFAAPVAALMIAFAA